MEPRYVKEWTDMTTGIMARKGMEDPLGEDNMDDGMAHHDSSASDRVIHFGQQAQFPDLVMMCDI